VLTLTFGKANLQRCPSVEVRSEYESLSPAWVALCKPNLSHKLSRNDTKVSRKCVCWSATCINALTFEIRYSHGHILRSLYISRDDSRLVESSTACPEYDSQKVKSGLSRACRRLAPAPAPPQRPHRPVSLFRSAK
jgi:hypothetical protein